MGKHERSEGHIFPKTRKKDEVKPILLRISEATTTEIIISLSTENHDAFTQRMLKEELIRRGVKT